MLVQVTEDSEPDNVGDCKVLNAFRLGALGCNVALTHSADLCDLEYDLICLSDVRITIKVKQLQDDGIEGTLSKVDLDKNGMEQCTLDLKVVVKNTPAPTRPDADE